MVPERPIDVLKRMKILTAIILIAAIIAALLKNINIAFSIIIGGFIGLIIGLYYYNRLRIKDPHAVEKGFAVFFIVISLSLILMKGLVHAIDAQANTMEITIYLVFLLYGVVSYALILFKKQKKVKKKITKKTKRKSKN